MILGSRSLGSDGGLYFEVIFDLPLIQIYAARRICPGRYLADQSLFAVIASVLSVFSITLPLDEQGNPVPLEGEMSNEMIT